MRTGYTTRRQAEAAFDGLDADEEDVSARQDSWAATLDTVELGHPPDQEAEIDRLLAQVDHELAAELRTESYRTTREFTDQRQAHRAHRRAARLALRSLPTQLDAADSPEGEAA
jgi:hypothetical protein